MDLTCVLFQFMGHGAPAMAMQGLFYNQPCHYYGAAFSREQLGARTTVTFPRPFFPPPPRAFMHVPFGESFPPHLSSLLVSPLLSGGFPTQQYQQAAGRGGGMGADGRRACSQDWDTARPTPPEATPWTRLSAAAPFFLKRERGRFVVFFFSLRHLAFILLPSLSLLFRFVFSLSPSFC